MKFTKTFKELRKEDTGIAGGKGASLGEMTAAGIPVPPGFVVLAESFDQFLIETDLGPDIEAILKRVKHHNVASVEEASVEIRDLIHDQKVPKDIATEIVSSFKKLKAPLVAVRSSATAEDSSEASWAGELESYLNVTSKNVVETVKKCWSSLFTPRAIFYRREKKLHTTRVSVAVVIQKMVQSEVSGICFTVHPVTKDHNQLIIEAGYGLGESIVGGMITPDTYVINKKTLEVEERSISEQSMKIERSPKGTKESVIPVAKRSVQKLKEGHILALAKLCISIEKHYKKPEDIEWAMEKNKLYIVQSRPITTL